MLTSSAVRSTLDSSSAPARSAPKLPTPGAPWTGVPDEEVSTQLPPPSWAQALHVAKIDQRQLAGACDLAVGVAGRDDAVLADLQAHQFACGVAVLRQVGHGKGRSVLRDAGEVDVGRNGGTMWRREVSVKVSWGGGHQVARDVKVELADWQCGRDRSQTRPSRR